MRCERYKRYDWGLDSTTQLEVRPKGTLRAITLGPDDEAGCVRVEGLPLPDPVAKVTAGKALLCTVDGNESTLLFYPAYALAGGPNAAYKHTLDLWLWYDDLDDERTGPRAPAREELSVGAADSGSAYLCVVGRRKLQTLVTFTGAGTAGAYQVFQVLIQGTTVTTVKVVDESSLSSGVYPWSPAARDLSAGGTELDGCDFLVVYVNTGANLTAEVLLRAEDEG